METKNNRINNFSHPAVIITVLILIFLGGYFLLSKNYNSKQSEIDALKTEVENLKNPKPAPVENHLTTSLTPFQFSQNINALITQGADTKVIQEYINNYQKDSSGNFVLKSSQ